MSVDFSKMEASLAAEADAEKAVEGLLVTLTLAVEIDARTATLSAAIVANTPAATPVP